MSGYQYPRLSRQDILGMLAECQIAVSEADIVRPESEFICNLYTQIDLTIGTSQEDDGQIEFGALELLENPDSHTHTIQPIQLYNKIRKLLEDVKCPKAFTPKDLIHPEPQRTELFLSALLNFLLHRLSKKRMLKPYNDELTEFAEKEEAVKARISELEAEIAKCEESSEAASSKIEELRQTVSGLNNHQMNLKTSAKQMKEKAKEMDEKISVAEFALHQSLLENGNLHSKIVQSPEKLQRALETKKVVQSEAKNAERAAHQTFLHKTNKLEAYTKAVKKISKHFSKIQALEEQANNSKSVDKKIKDCKAKLSDEEFQMKSLEAKLLELQSKVGQLEEQRRQLERERDLSKEEVDKELENIKLEVEAMSHTLDLRHRQVVSMVAESEDISTRKKIVEEDGEAKLEELWRNCEKIVTEKLLTIVKQLDMSRELINEYAQCEELLASLILDYQVHF